MDALERVLKKNKHKKGRNGTKTIRDDGIVKILENRFAKATQLESPSMEASIDVSLKLLVDVKGQRVLFAEAGKHFVDFLFNIMSLPVGTVVRLLNKEDMAGSLGNIYKSIEKLSDVYMQQPLQDKEDVLKPKVLLTPAARNLPHLLPNIESLNYLTSSAESDEGGVVKEVVTYMVMDDLMVKPISTISTLYLLNKFNVKDATALEERTIKIGSDEAVKLLNASLQSKTVLTDVFFAKSSGNVSLPEYVI